MATAKAKLHLIMSKMDKKCQYETRPLTHTDTRPPVPQGLNVFKVEDLMFVCTLHLPDGSTVESSSFRRKKDAEQDAALLALQKLEIPYELGALPSSMHERWEGLLQKVCLAFTDQMMLSYKPLAEHFRAAVQRKGSRFGQVPALLLTILDAKITSQCKSIDQLAENSPAHAAALVCRAAATCPTLRLSDDGLWIGRSGPLSAELVTKLLSDQVESVIPEPDQYRIELEIHQLTIAASKPASHFGIVYIPAYAEKELRTVHLTATPNAYYLDIIAHELGLPDAGHVLLTRQIGKAPLGTRMYWPLKERLPKINIPDIQQLELFIDDSDLCPKDATMEALRHPVGLITRNDRASFLVGHAIDGDAILATVGSSWQSEGKCLYNDFSVSCFHRLMLGRTPWGAYKLSRQSLLVADLPKVYTCRAQWQGASPKSLLADFCHQHHLPEARFICTCPQGSIIDRGGEGCSDFGEHARQELSINEEYFTKDQSHGAGRQGPFHCKVLVGAVGDDSKVDFESDGFFRSRHDAIQSAALNAVLRYDRWCGTSCLPGYFQMQECCKSSHSLSFVRDSCPVEADLVASVNPASSEDIPCNSEGRYGATEGVSFEVIAEDVILGDQPLPGSMVLVSYSVNISSHNLEAQAEFKFELGAGAVIGPFDACVSQARVGQTLQFHIPGDTLGILVAASNSLDKPKQDLVLEYTVKLLKFAEALEERMESSHFSPPLSKQRIEFARTMINALEAKSLVDLGCGSGSLLEALLKEPNTLEHILGIDTSQKALVRAAKTLNATLTKQNPDNRNLWPNLQKISLVEGTIAELDPGLHSPDLATCIEVVEHMDPEPLDRLGESVLGRLVPKVWMVSTPNIEYNPIIRGLDWDPESNSLHESSQKESLETVERKKLLDADPPNFRNHDHRFEWTRAEFRDWASRLALQYGYLVSFTGVGGDGGEDDDDGPGFATQIALFAHKSVLFPADTESDNSSLIPKLRVASEVSDQYESGRHSMSPFKELWHWTSTEGQELSGNTL